MLKRSLDLFFSLFLLIAGALPLAVIALIIKCSSCGPVLFKQQRIGKDKKEFAILKFRTMYQDTPKDVPTHLLEDPERFITPIGRFMRRTSIDELPQLVNILLGHMSFIGPRPALYNQEDLIGLRDLYNINSIRPGLTGYAQVHGRDELPIPEKVELDRYYYENRSLRLDCRIFFRTFSSVWKHEGVVEGKQNVK